MSDLRELPPPRVENSGGDSVGLDFWRFYTAVTKRLWLVALVFVLTVSGVAFRTFRQTKYYRASASLVIEVNTPQVLKGVSEVVDLGTGNYWSTKEYFATQYKILKSRAVAEKVISRLGLDHDDVFLGLNPHLSAEERARARARLDPVQLLIDRIQVIPVRDSRVVEVAFEDPDPKRAAELANAVCEEYIEQNVDRKLATTQGASAWLVGQLSTLKKQLEDSERALFKFKQDHDVLSTSLEARQNITTERLISINDALTKTGLRRVQLGAERDQLQKILEESRDADFQAESFKPVAINLTIGDLKREYFRLLSERAETAERYLPDHPKRAAIEERVKRVKEDIRHAIHVVLRTAEAEYRQVEGEEKSLRGMLDQSKRDALAVNSLEIDHDRLKRDREQFQQVYELMVKRQKEVDIAGLLRTNNIRMLDTAIVPQVPSRPNRPLNLAFGVVFGLVLGILFVLVLELLDNTVKTQDDVEKAVGLPLLGIMPTIPLEIAEKSARETTPHRDLYIHSNPKSSISECARAIRTSLLFASPDRPFKVLLIASCGPREGKSTCSISISITMAQSGNRVLLVDGDLRRPRLHRTFGLPSAAGLSTLILGESTPEAAIHESVVPNLFILPAGPVPPNPAELLNSARYQEVLKELGGRFDRIIIDSPPVGAVADALVMSAHADGLVMVLRAGATLKNAAIRGTRAFRGVKAHIYGAVLNDVELGSRLGQYYYYYRYGYYPSEKYRAAQQGAAA